jgi:hypothetical protein
MLIDLEPFELIYLSYAPDFIRNLAPMEWLNL